MATLTGVRLQRFNALPAFRNDQGGDADRRYQIMLLQRQQRVADKSNAKREELRVAREALERIHARELKKQADIEAKRLRDIRIERDLALARAKREEINRKARERRAKRNSLTVSTAQISADILSNSDRAKDTPNCIYTTTKFDLHEDMLPKIKLVKGMILSADLINEHATYIEIIDSFQFELQEKEISYNPVSKKIVPIEEVAMDKINSHYNGSSSLKPNMARKVVNSTHFRISVFQPIVAKKVKQKFRDGNVHCVFNAIENYYTILRDEAKSDKTRANRQSIINKCVALAKQYDAGVPEDKINEVAKMLDVSIVINNVSQHEIIRGNTNAKNKTFSYINSRKNHLENITFDLNTAPTPIEREDAYLFLKICIEERIWNTFTGTFTNPKTITTANERFIVGDDLSDILFNFTKSFDRGMSINYIKESQLCIFIMKGAHLMINYVNESCKDKPANEIDMKKAYTQFKKCPMYMGFPSIISDVRFTSPDHDIISNPGVYQIMIHSFTQESYKGYIGAFNNGVAILSDLKRDSDDRMKLLRDYGFAENKTYILTSPWIEQLKQCGVSLSIIKGAWGKRFDFDFPQEMIQEKLYAVWTGMQLARAEDSHIKMACDREFAEIIASQHEVENFSYNEALETLSITKKKDHHFIMPHLSAFIVSYTQLQVFAEACKYSHDMIYAHKLDSIVLTCDPEPFDESLWQHADVQGTDIKINKRSQNYIFNKDSVDYPIFHKNVTYPLDTLGNIFISGAGGSGKTELILGDHGYKSPLFVSMAWELIADKINEYSVKGSSINQLLGYDIYGKKTESYKDKHGSPPVIVHDEYSMSNLDILERTIAMYPHSKLICLADYDGMYFQSSIHMEGKPLYHPKVYTLLDTDYRSIDQETIDFKCKIRSIMKNGGCLLQYILENCISVSEEELRMLYNNDFVITGTHNRIKYFTNMLTGENNHHKVMKHTYEDVLKKCSGRKDIVLHGEILDYPIEGRTEIHHGFTAHSFQGKTIKEKKCFIDLSHLTCNQDIYTALSRIRSISQLFVIKGNYKTVCFSNGQYIYN